MRINEFTEVPNLEDVDLLDDLHFFMQNDPSFYRKVFYPLLSMLKKHVKTGKHCKNTIFRSCIDHAITLYCKKFNIPDNEKSVFTDVDRDSLARKIFAQEVERIEQGDYDGRDE